MIDNEIFSHYNSVSFISSYYIINYFYFLLTFESILPITSLP